MNSPVIGLVSTKTGELIVLPQVHPGLLFLFPASVDKQKEDDIFMKG